jgi:subtilisin family serine protease
LILSSPFLAASALAQTNNGYVGIYRDALGTQACATVPPYTSATLYVIAKTAGQSASGITGAEFRIEVTNPSGWYLSYTPPGTASVTLGNPIDTDPDPNAGGGLNLGFPSCQVPDGNGLIALGTLSVFNASGTVTNLLVKRHSQPTNPGFACALFVRCDAPSFTKVCMTPSAPDSCTLGTQKGMPIAADDPTISTAALNESGGSGGGSEVIPPERQVLASFRKGIVQLPQGQTKALLAQTTISSPEIATVIGAYGVESIEKAFPNFNLADTLGISRTGEVVRLTNLSEIYALNVPVGGNTLGLATDLDPLDGVGYAEQNGTAEPAATTCTFDSTFCPPLTIENCPDDPSFLTQQWSLVNVGQAGGFCGADIGVQEAWATFAQLGDPRPGNSSIKIAIIDVGIDADHEEMAGKVSGDAGWWSGFPEHGTHVAGIAAANTDNGRGIAGVDWDAQLISRRIDGLDLDGIANVVREAANDSNPSLRAHVLNSSWTTNRFGLPFYSSTVREAFRDVYMLNRVQTVAMGNTGSTAMGKATSEGASTVVDQYPAAFGLGQINVGAMNRSNLYSTVSSTGDHIDVAAPGEAVYSSVPGNSYDVLTGTSMAAPHVAGLASLLLAAKPWLHADDVRQVIRLSATDMVDLPLYGPGEDKHTGTGRINAGAALSKLLYPNELRHAEAVGGRMPAEDVHLPHRLWRERDMGPDRRSGREVRLLGARRGSDEQPRHRRSEFVERSLSRLRQSLHGKGCVQAQATSCCRTQDGCFRCRGAQSEISG